MDTVLNVSQIKSDVSLSKTDSGPMERTAPQVQGEPGSPGQEAAVEIEIDASDRGMPNVAIPHYTAEKELKLFTGGSLPLKGLFEIRLIDENGDGRVDAGDAVSKYIEMTRQGDSEARKKAELVA